MNLMQALHLMVGNTSMVAVRPEGEILHMTRNCAIKNLAANTPRPWIATLGPLLADNWQVLPIEKVFAPPPPPAGQGS